MIPARGKGDLSFSSSHATKPAKYCLGELFEVCGLGPDNEGIACSDAPD